MQVNFDKDKSNTSYTNKIKNFLRKSSFYHQIKELKLL